MRFREKTHFPLAGVGVECPGRACRRILQASVHIPPPSMDLPESQVLLVEDDLRMPEVLASLLQEAKAGRHTDFIFEVAEALRGDADDMVQKGVGWLLKEAYPNARGAGFSVAGSQHPVVSRGQCLRRLESAGTRAHRPGFARSGPAGRHERIRSAATNQGQARDAKHSGHCLDRLEQHQRQAARV